MPVTPGPLYVPNPATVRAEVTKLSASPDGRKLVYVNGRTVVIRDLEDPHGSEVYTEHVQPTTVARISPSGYYCASADIAGNVRIWDISNPDKTHILKFTNRPIAGKINDLAWDSESKRIVIGGEGRDKQGAAFFIESGSSCGEITGHSKAITAIDVRQQRPFRAITGSDDNTVCLHTAVPFKYDKMLSHHTRFVRDVRYAPNGELSATVGSDGKLFLLDGKTGEIRHEAGNGQASLMGVSWSKDSAKLATAGADGIVTLWDASTGQSSQTYSIGNAVEDQQNGIVWANENTIASVSLDGTLNILDPREGTKWRKLYGPTKAITAGALGKDKDQTFYVGSTDGGVKKLSGGNWDKVEGQGHSAKVAAMSAAQDKVTTAGWDDRALSIENGSFASGSSIPTKGQPTGVASSASLTAVSSTEGVVVQPASGASFTHPGSYTAVAISSTGSTSPLIALGSGKTLSIHSIANGKLSLEFDVNDNKGDILSIAFSTDGQLVAAGDAQGRITLVNIEKKETVVSSRWTFHSGRVLALAWSDQGRLASAGLDESIYIWDPKVVGKNVAIKNAHPGGVTSVAWTADDKLISAGTDGCARTWTLA